MERRKLGKIKVGVTGIGLAQLGRDGDFVRAERIIHAALDAGVDLFDTADIYGHSDRGPFYSEEFLGRALRGRRSKAVISTKVGYSTDPVPGAFVKFNSLSAAYIEQAVDASLRRLQTDYIDLYQPHTFDTKVPIEETLGAFARLIEKGKVRQIGSSRFTPAQVLEADAAARKGHLPRFVSSQAGLNLLQRSALTRLVPTLEELGQGLIPFSPLASGFLTGKYRENKPLPPGAALTKAPPQLGGRLLNEHNYKILEALDKWAIDHGHTILDLAFAWLAGHKIVVSVIAGATSAEQVTQNVKAGSWKLNAGQVQEVSKIVQSFDASEPMENTR